MTEFADRTILITGALGSLGWAQAERFAAERPKRLLLLDRPHLDGPSRASRLEDRHGVPCDFIAHDLGALRATESLAASLDPVDVLSSNAAQIVNKPFEEFSIEEYEDQLRVNAAATFALVRGLAPGMKRRRDGRIVTFSSLTLNGRWDGYVPYVASKGAILGLTKSLARELGPFGIRINAIAPGAVASDAETRVFGDRLQAYNDWIVENQSLKSRIEPADVAELALFLSSDRARMITGQSIGLDGGW